jgi:hypothetical protein
VRRRQAHRHVEVGRAGGQRTVEDRHDEARVDGVEHVGDAVRLDEPATASAREASTWAASTRVGDLVDERLRARRVVVGDDELLEEVAADGDADGGRADASGADDEDTHEIPCR